MVTALGMQPRCRGYTLSHSLVAVPHWRATDPAQSGEHLWDAPAISHRTLQVLLQAQSDALHFILHFDVLGIACVMFGLGVCPHHFWKNSVSGQHSEGSISHDRIAENDSHN